MTPAGATAPARRSPAGEYQFTAAIGHLHTAWAALVDVERITPGDPHASDDPAGEELAAPPAHRRRCRAERAAVVFDAGYSAAALTAGLAGHTVHLLVRLAAGSVFYGDPVTRPGNDGRPGKHGAAVTCHKADAADQANPEPDESLTRLAPRCTAPSRSAPGTRSTRWPTWPRPR
ncbi:MAG TPA: hypothetical protein VGH77_01065 [Streptosporangiaceae bacterium]|jgi:hypothetical protein